MAFVPSQHDKKVAQFIRARRGERTYAEFASISGISKTVLYRLENRQQSLTLAKLEALARRLRVRPDDILSGKAR